MGVGHCFEVRIDWENDISDALVNALISELLRKFPYELAHGVVIVAEQFLAYLTALAFEFDRVGVGQELHFLVLIDYVLEIQPFLVEFLHPFFGQFRTHLENEIVVANQCVHGIFLLLTDLANLVDSRCTIRLIYFDAAAIALDANRTQTSLALMLLVHYQLEFLVTYIAVALHLLRQTVLTQTQSSRSSGHYNNRDFKQY